MGRAGITGGCEAGGMRSCRVDRKHLPKRFISSDLDSVALFGTGAFVNSLDREGSIH